MENQNRKFVTVGRILFGIFVFLIIIPFHASAENETVQHVHDANCGYVEAIEGHPCEHVHDEKCGYVEAQKEIPCDMNCVDKDGDGIIDHDEKCSYRPAIEGHPCEHVHDDKCGYVEAVQGQPCQYEEQLKAQQEAQKDVSTYADGNEISFDEFKAECLSKNRASNGNVEIDLSGKILILNQGEGINKELTNYLSNEPSDPVAHSLKISNGTIKRGSNNGYSLVEIWGTNLTSFTLENITLDNSSIDCWNAGGIYNTDSDQYSGFQNMTLTNCLFKNFQSLDSKWGESNNAPICFKSSTNFNFQMKDIQFENCYNNYGLVQLQSHFNGTIDNLTIDGQDKKSIGVNIQSAYNSSVKILNSHFTNCSIGIDAAGGLLETQSNTISKCETGIYVDRYDNAHYGNVQINSDKLTDNNIGVNFNTKGQLSLNGNVIIKDNVDANLQLNNAFWNKVMIKDLGQDANVGIGIDESDLSEGIVLAQKDSSSNTDFNDDFTHLSSDHEDAKYILAVNTDDNTIKLVKKAETKYIVQFDSVGGTAVSSVEVIEGSKLISPTSDPTKEHYVFDGWYTDDKYTTKWDFDKDVVTSNMTLYAKWKTVEYKISYDLDGGTNHSDNPSSYTIESESITLKNPSKEGYTFKGWKCDGNGEPVEEVTIAKGSTGNKTFTACWEIKHFTVTFNSHDGTSVESQTIDYNGLIQQPNSPVKEHYIFGGWYTDEECTTQWDFSKDFVTKDIELHAKWTPENYNVIFTIFNEKYSNQIVEYNKKVTRPENPTKTGYEFVEWYKDSELIEKWDFDKDVVTSNVTLYAKWNLVNYTISYELNGGTNDKSNPSQYTVESADIQLKAPTKAGYTFIGWTYGDKDEPVTTIAKGSTGDKTFKANWKINQYTVIFHTYGGTEIKNQVVDYNTKVTQPENPTKAGYKFVGWYSDEAYKNQYDFDLAVVKDIELYAKYEEIQTVSKPVSNVAADKRVDKGTKVELSSSTQGATIYYTVDGSVPSSSSLKYTSPILIEEDMTIKAIAIKDEMKDSEVSVFQYRIKLQVSNPISSHASGKISRKSNNISLSCETKKATLYYTLDGSDPKTNGKVYANGSLIKITQDTTLKIWATMNDQKNYVDSDVVTYEYKMLEQVEKPTSSLNGESIKKGTIVELSTSTPDAKIYYTTDGSLPTQESLVYEKGIVLDKDVTIKAIAIKEGMDDSEIGIYQYQIISEGHVDVIIKVEGPENITIPDKQDILGAVLTKEDYEMYNKGNDILITLECVPLEDEPEAIDQSKISDYKTGKHLDISIYKQIGNGEKEKITELNKPIQLIIDVPNELLPEGNTVRIYSLLRVHEGEHAILEDKDEKLETITVESHKFSRYVILYKDIVSGDTEDKNQGNNNATNTPTQSSTKTGDESPLIGYGILLGASLLGLAMSIKKRKLK